MPPGMAQGTQISPVLIPFLLINWATDFDFPSQDALLLIIMSKFLLGNTQALIEMTYMEMTHLHPHLQGETCDSGLATQVPTCPNWFRKSHMNQTRPIKPMLGFY